MNIVRNEKLIRRNARIGQVTSIGALLVLAGGMFVSFRAPDQVVLSWGALLLGFLLFQVGVFFGSRWGRRPRPDEVLDQALKGLDNKHTLYHYKSPVNHLLVGPTGVWVLQTSPARGTITFSAGRWRQRGGNLYFKLFGQESLGRPDLELSGAVETIERFLNKNLSEEKIPEVQAALVFLNPATVIDISDDEQTPAATVSAKELKDLIRKSGKTKSISPEKAKLIQEALPAE